MFQFPAQRPTAARSLAFALDGTIVAAGDFGFLAQRTFGLVRIEPAHGQASGFAFLDTQHDGVANALAMLGNDAVAAGEVASDTHASEFTVARFGPFGNVIWSTHVNGNASCGADVAHALAIDVELGIFAAGQLTNTGIEADSPIFTIVKLAPNGSVIWRRELGVGVARALVLDGGFLYVTGTFDGTFSVVKLTAGNGDVLWQKDVGAGEGLAIVRGNDGNVVAAGRLGGQFGVVTLAGTNGSSVWLPTRGLLGPGVARDVVRLASGHIVAAGETDDGGELRFTTARFDAATGSVFWQDSDPDVPAPASAYGVAAAGDQVVTVGTAAHEGGPTSFSVRALDAEEGGLRWGTGILSDFPETRAYTVRADAEGNVVIAGALQSFFPAANFTVQKLDPDGNDFEDPCGNDELDPGEQCDDGNNFDGDCCSATCTFEANGDPCEDDDNDCTDDVCDGEGQCSHRAVEQGSFCNDGNECTTNEFCVGTTCQGDPEPIGTPCNADSNMCTTDACNADGVCVGTPNADACDDGNDCTAGDTCMAGFCLGQPQSGNQCTDFDPCSANDTCNFGICAGTPAPGLPCLDDGNPCTDDVCAGDVVVFCQHLNNDAPCNDANACTIADHCENGACTGIPGQAPTTTSTTSTTSSSTSSSTSTSTAAPTTSSTSSSTSTSSTSTSSSSSTSTSSTTTTSPVPTTSSSSTSSTSTLQPTTTSSTTTSSSSTTVETTSTTVATTSTTTSPSVPTTSTTEAPTTTTVETTTTTSSSTAPPESSTTSTSSSSSTTVPVPTTTTLPAPCTRDADCDDGDPCNGGETCTGGTCLVARADASPVCTGADALAVVTRFDADAVTLVNTRTRAIDSTIAVGDSPWGVAWAHDGGRIYVTNRKSDSVSVIDSASRAVIATIPVGKTPLGVAVHPFLPRAYVTSYVGDRVDVIDTTTLAVVDRIGVGNGPSGLAMHPAGAQLFVANYIGGTISVVDLATNTVDATVATPALPVGIAIHPGGTKAYVACLKGREVAVIGTVSRSLLRTIRVGRKPIGVAFDDAGARAYVTNSGDDTVTVLDAGADTAIAKRPVGDFPIGIAVAGDGTVWVAGSNEDTLDVLGEGDGASVPVPDTPVAIGDFIGTPPNDCPAAPLPCDDANPFTGDACRPDAGCVRDDITGFAAVKVGTDTIAALIEQGDPADPLVTRLRDRLGALQSAVEAAGTGGDRAALALVRKSLQPILRELEAARKRGTLGQDGARLLDVARETKRQVKRLARGGRT